MLLWYLSQRDLIGLSWNFLTIFPAWFGYLIVPTMRSDIHEPRLSHWTSPDPEQERCGAAGEWIIVTWFTSVVFLSFCSCLHPQHVSSSLLEQNLDKHERGRIRRRQRQVVLFRAKKLNSCPHFCKTGESSQSCRMSVLVCSDGT